MLDQDTMVQGFAVYAEFSKPGQTQQILITPDMYTNAGEIVPVSLNRRLVTPETLKKQWKRISLESTTVQALIAQEEELLEQNIEPVMGERVLYARPLFDELLNSEWKLVAPFFVVEVTKHDADDISANKTPNKVLYRISLCRTALGYPAELV